MFRYGDTPLRPDAERPTPLVATPISPGPVTPLTWSILGPCLEEAYRTSLCDDFGFQDRPGFAHPNQIVVRTDARIGIDHELLLATTGNLPGTSADLLDLQIFGGVATPADGPAGEEKRHLLRGSSALGRTMAGIGRRLNRDRTAVEALIAQVDAVEDGDDAERSAWAIRPAMAVWAAALGTHLTCRGLAGPVVQQARAALHRAGVSDADALRVVSEADETQVTARRALVELAAQIPAGSRLADVVAGGDHRALAESDVAGADVVSSALDRFVIEFGHRGPWEFDPTAASWVDRRDELVAVLSRTRPVVTVPPPDVDPGRLGRPLVAAARTALARVERSQDTAALAAHQIRRLLGRTRRQPGVAALGADMVHLQLDELEAIDAGGSPPRSEEVSRRRAEFEAAVAEPAAPDPMAAVADGLLDGFAGLGAAPGTAVGTAVVLREPVAVTVEGGVLVAPTTDDAWLTHLAQAGAVVIEEGGALGHTARWARDLGIPAVVLRGATALLRSGDTLEVDGDAGRVRLSPAPGPSRSSREAS